MLAMQYYLGFCSDLHYTDDFSSPYKFISQPNLIANATHYFACINLHVHDKMEAYSSKHCKTLYNRPRLSTVCGVTLGKVLVVTNHTFHSGTVTKIAIM